MNQSPSRRDEVLSRRRFIKLGVCAALAVAALPARAASAERRLAFYNVHTGESLERVYWAEGNYDEQALTDISFLMRDYRNDEALPIAPALLDLLHALRAGLDSTEPMHLISGYRSPTTNAMLAARSGEVARHSMHLEGKAADIFLPGRNLDELHRAALALQGGGVGYYPRSRFVHVDIGRVRRWQGA